MPVEFTKNMEKAMEHLHKKGAFLTSKEGDKVNTMTISWGNIGFEWKKPIFTVLVRKSRYTHGIIERTKKFTVTIPVNEKMKEALAFCGTKSGKDVDKIKSCDLEISKGKAIDCPVISKCGIVYECRVLYKQDMDLSSLDSEIKKECYSDNDIHTMYYGEIVASYENN